MDQIQLFLLFALSLFYVSYFLMKSMYRPKNKKRMAPMVPGAWPLIGHLRAFENGQPTHVTFGNMADVHGPVFMTKTGSVNVMIINSQEVAKEIYTVHDRFLNRPVPATASKLMGYNGSFFSFSPERCYWREIRKIAISEILSTGVVDMQSCRAGEVDVAFRDLYRKWEGKSGGWPPPPQTRVLVDMKQELQDLTQNMSLMMIAGKRYFGESPNCEIGEAKRCRKLLRDLYYYFGFFFVSDLVPCLGWLDWRIKKLVKKTGSELDEVIETWIEERKKKRKDCGEKNFLDRLIEIFEQDENLGLDDAHTSTKAICLNLVLSGPEAATVILVWAVSLLVNNPHVLRKAQEELNSKIGQDRVVEESDIKDLVYLQAIFKETFRLYPPVALTAYRTVIEDFDVANGSFHVPAGTEVLVNAWKIHRDPNFWSDPEEFKPERFLTSNREVDLGRQNYHLFPFGLGRKACPAIPLGMRMVQYVLARFLQSFDVERPSSEYVDMTGCNGLVNLKATPLQVFITPKLHKSLYYLDHKV